METVRRQWSGNAKGVIRGIGVVNCIYVNPKTDRFWIIDYRLYDPEADGKTKIDHLREMLNQVQYQKRLPFYALLIYAVLMETWYASRKVMRHKVMRHIERLEKIYYCPIKKNRLVEETGGAEPHESLEDLSWSASEEAHGKSIHIKNFPAGHRPAGHRVKLFRLVVSSDRTDYVVTNDTS